MGGGGGGGGHPNCRAHRLPPPYPGLSKHVRFKSDRVKSYFTTVLLYTGRSGEVSYPLFVFAESKVHHGQYSSPLQHNPFNISCRSRPVKFFLMTLLYLLECIAYSHPKRKSGIHYTASGFPKNINACFFFCVSLDCASLNDIIRLKSNFFFLHKLAMSSHSNRQNFMNVVYWKMMINIIFNCNILC